MPAPNSPGQPPGTELDYVEVGDITVSGSSGAQTTVIDGNPIWFDGDTTVLIEYQTCNAGSGSQALIVELWDGGSSLKRIAQTAPSLSWPLRASLRVKPSAGLHTFHVKAWINGGTNATLAGDGSGVYVKQFYRVVKC